MIIHPIISKSPLWVLHSFSSTLISRVQRWLTWRCTLKTPWVWGRMRQENWQIVKSFSWTMISKGHAAWRSCWFWKRGESLHQPENNWVQTMPMTDKELMSCTREKLINAQSLPGDANMCEWWLLPLHTDWPHTEPILICDLAHHSMLNSALLKSQSSQILNVCHFPLNCPLLFSVYMFCHFQCPVYMLCPSSMSWY